MKNYKWSYRFMFNQKNKEQLKFRKYKFSVDFSEWNAELISKLILYNPNIIIYLHVLLINAMNLNLIYSTLILTTFPAIF